MLAAFEKPTTKDFVWPCWGPSVRVLGVTACYNFIFFLVTLAVISTVGFFFVAFRKPSIVPGKLQLVAELGFQFVRKPLIALINFVSEIIFRPITLTVRLFANMVAGHFLLAVFFLGTLALFSTANFLIIFGLISSVMAVAFVAFEIFVSILQAFIFAVLSASYISEAMEAAH